ncbi:MAG: cytidine deaminase [Acidobacteriota bacterium]
MSHDLNASSARSVAPAIGIRDQPPPGAESIDWDTLVDTARAAQKRAHAPYSDFHVGAALLLDDGRVIEGCNVENRSFGLCICAERLAVARAIADAPADARPQLVALVVITHASPPGMPCGMCLETLTEFARDLPILTTNHEDVRRFWTLRQLHPVPFEWSEKGEDSA